MNKELTELVRVIALQKKK